MTTEERFWRKVDRRGPDECWEWTACRDRHGYGIFQVGRKADGTRRAARAHRIAWEFACGPILEGLCVCHTCDCAACVNIAHLFLGTMALNMADRDAKGRQARSEKHGARLHPESRPRGDRNSSRQHPERLVRGEKHGRAKLTELDIHGIRRLRELGLTQTEIANRYGVSQKQVSNILHGVRWAHVKKGDNDQIKGKF